MTREEIILKLREAGISPLESRIAIYSWIDANRVHPTVDAIYRALCPTHPTLSRTTVYNTLKTLAKGGLVGVLNIDDGELRYDANVSAHAHAKCRNCGKVVDVFGVDIQPMEDRMGSWHVENCQINYYGICPDCSSKD